MLGLSVILEGVAVHKALPTHSTPVRPVFAVGHLVNLQTRPVREGFTTDLTLVILLAAVNSFHVHFEVVSCQVCFVALLAFKWSGSTVLQTMKSQAVVKVEGSVTQLTLIGLGLAVDSPAMVIQGLLARENLSTNITLVFLDVVGRSDVSIQGAL